MQKRSSIHPFAVIICAAVAVIILVSLQMLDPPATVRLQKLDDKRAHDLHAICSSILAYKNNEKRLPLTLADLQLPEKSMKDPQTAQTYEYNNKGDLSYELCATFNTKSESPEHTYNKFLKHESGRICYSLKNSCNNN